MTVRSLEVADEDLLIAARRLEEARTGSGSRLLAEYRIVVENLERFPQMYPLVEDELTGREVRNAILSDLSYRIVHAVREVEVLIVAIPHTRQRLGSWHNRLTGDQ